MNKLLSYINGKKTYLLTFAAGVYTLGIENQLWQHWPLLDVLLGSGIITSLRHGIAKSGTATENQP